MGVGGRGGVGWVGEGRGGVGGWVEDRGRGVLGCEPRTEGIVEIA